MQNGKKTSYCLTEEGKTNSTTSKAVHKTMDHFFSENERNPTE